MQLKSRQVTNKEKGKKCPQGKKIQIESFTLSKMSNFHKVKHSEKQERETHTQGEKAVNRN